MVKLVLIEARSKIKVAEKNKAIIYASKNGHTEIVKLLIKAGAYVPAEFEYRVLTIVTSKGYIEILRLLLKNAKYINRNKN
ncbi:MAG: ankyrin repeat domain-containing protein [Clostridia bacterium]|nr:ankyrin repeat domain-containing protein [Clostridia bacterium]